MNYSITKLEFEKWSRNVAPDINTTYPEGYEPVNTSSGLRLYCAGPAYGGWLAKLVSPLIVPAQRITFSYDLTIDDATPTQAQVVETDTKITDSDGFTYDLSAQWNIVKNWMFQVQNPWVDTGISIIPPVPGTSTQFSLSYFIDYVNKASSISSVAAGGIVRSLPANLLNYPAKQVGWEKMQIVTQLQQCNNSNRGAHSQLFQNIRYDLVG